MSKPTDRRFKTKFPVARIKRIMQIDEDVGKVAQATPILISKALELFMHALITETCKETRARNAKRMTVGHLKRCIEQTDQYDFLRDLVAKIPDPISTNEESQSKSATSSSASKPILRGSDIMSLKHITEPNEPEDAEDAKEEKKVKKRRVRKRKDIAAED